MEFCLLRYCARHDHPKLLDETGRPRPAGRTNAVPQSLQATMVAAYAYPSRPAHDRRSGIINQFARRSFHLTIVERFPRTGQIVEHHNPGIRHKKGRLGVTSASEIPPPRAARPVPFPWRLPLRRSECRPPFPNSQTKGAVETIVARPPKPRFSSACTRLRCDSSARVDASMVSPGISPGLSWWALNSIRPAVTTFARWLFCTARRTLIASSLVPSSRRPATDGRANERGHGLAGGVESHPTVSSITPIATPHDEQNDNHDLRQKTHLFPKRNRVPNRPALVKEPGGKRWKLQSATDCPDSLHELRLLRTVSSRF